MLRSVNILLSLLVTLGGCHWQPLDVATVPLPATPVAAENPMFLPITDREFLWNHVVDTVDDYFKISREERVRFIDGVLIEGRLDTYPQAGATLLEPWRKDSTAGYEKLHATLQSIRRHSIVRVIPDNGGYWIDVAVFKELEDLNQPEDSSVGAATIRHDGSLVRGNAGLNVEPRTLGWIPLGRDITLEHQILNDLRARLLNVVPERLPAVQ